MAKKKLEITPKTSKDLHVVRVEKDGLSTNLRLSKTLYNLPMIDLDNLQELEERTEWYFNRCQLDSIKPSMAGLCAAYGISRRTMHAWQAGGKGVKFQKFVERIMIVLEAAMESYMTSGQINPVSGIFLMKNHFGYTDKQELAVTATHLMGEAEDKEKLRQHYLDSLVDVGGDDD